MAEKPCIDMQTASVDDLQSMDHIGTTRAQKIVRLRKRHALTPELLASKALPRKDVSFWEDLVDKGIVVFPLVESGSGGPITEQILDSSSSDESEITGTEMLDMRTLMVELSKINNSTNVMMATMATKDDISKLNLKKWTT